MSEKTLADFRRPNYEEIRERINEYKHDEYRLGFMYQDIICGRESEVCGEGEDGVYAAQGIDSFHIKYLGEIDAVLFANRSAKRGGYYRPCMVPLNPDYEPYTKELKQYAGENLGYLFNYGPSFKTNMRYFRRHSEKCFKDLYWPRVEYTRIIERKIKRENILQESVNQNNKTVYLLELDNQPAKWYAAKDHTTIKMSTQVPSKWKPFSAHCIRKAKERQLEMHYQLTGAMMSIYGGWTYKGREGGVSDAMKHYQFDPILNPRDNLDILIKAAETYFPLLMIPYDTEPKNRSYLVE